MISSLGIVVMVSRSLCDGGAFVKWKRTNRNNRIAKKWHKKYGPVLSKCSRVVVEMPNKFVMCPCANEAVKQALPTKYDDLFKEQRGLL